MTSHLQNLSLSVDLSAVALFAPEFGINPLALSLALAAHGLDLLHHAGAQLLDPNLHAGTTAIGTLDNCASFATNT